MGAGIARMGHVVVVEERDEPRLGSLLAREGIAFASAPATLDVVRKLVRTDEPDLVVLEVTSITQTALRLCQSLQSEVPHVAVTVFAVRANERDVVEAYGAGAMTVVIEPVGSHELIARVRATLRRMPSRWAPVGERIVVGPVTLDRARREVAVHGELIALPRKEFEIAQVLMENAGGVVTKAQLVRALWGSPRDTKTLDVQVGRLRAKLVAAEGVQRIRTVRGLGFRFVTDEDLEHDAALDSPVER